jgi:translation initiation factor IF-2
MEDKNTEKAKNSSFAPVIAVLGHVDHGKTSLLDAFRKSDVAGGEAGGITQRIGATQIEVQHEGSLRKITLIDTPGHEAFANMRGYGVSAADIVLLVVAADDGVKPQTRESIKLLQDAKLPFIVVFTKKDAPGAIIEKVKQHVVREGILLEGLGGDTSYIAVSSKTGEGITDLLDLILLTSDMKDTKKDPNAAFIGVVIESKLDKRRGPLSTIVVKAGKLVLGDKLYQEQEIGKVRALQDAHGKNLTELLPGDAAEILGISTVLQTGSVVSSEKQAATIPVSRSVTQPGAHDLKAFFADSKEQGVKIVLKTEGKGELDAIRTSLPDDITIVYEGQGEISFSDMLLAKDFGGIVIGFNVGVSKDAKQFADNEHVFYRQYKIIYELLEEVSDASELLKEEKREKILGKAVIMASFPSGDQKILGVKIESGRLALNDNIRIMRGEKVVGSGKITSLKRAKQDVKEVAKGLECGFILTPEVDFSIGDMVLSYK